MASTRCRASPLRSEFHLVIGFSKHGADDNRGYEVGDGHTFSTGRCRDRIHFKDGESFRTLRSFLTSCSSLRSSTSRGAHENTLSSDPDSHGCCGRASQRRSAARPFHFSHSLAQTVLNCPSETAEGSSMPACIWQVVSFCPNPPLGCAKVHFENAGRCRLPKTLKRVIH